MNAFPPVHRFRAALCLFIAGLVLSGVTAFPLLLELRLLTDLLGVGYTPGTDEPRRTGLLAPDRAAGPRTEP